MIGPLFTPCQGYGRVGDALVAAYGAVCPCGEQVGHLVRKPGQLPGELLTGPELDRIMRNVVGG